MFFFSVLRSIFCKVKHETQQLAPTLKSRLPLAESKEFWTIVTESDSLLIIFDFPPLVLITPPSTASLVYLSLEIRRKASSDEDFLSSQDRHPLFPPLSLQVLF